MVRVRFAPSPTGQLHVGALRTALFNWLFARHNRGSLVLRIEDTDVSRSSEEMTESILEALQWVGLNWDEGPIYQSQRFDIYRQAARQLVSLGQAYYCFCTPEEIEKRRLETISSGQHWKYDRHCLHLSDQEKNERLEKGLPAAIRFLMPEGVTEFDDLIHGHIAVENKNLEDFVLLRSDGFPTYHLSVVVDDIDAGITHVIRGDDHISNTPKQILLYRAFQKEIPQFAHLPLILGPDRKKLSKRHGHTAVLSFRDQGYLPLVFFNFVAQLSWSPGKEERIYRREEMIEAFSLEHISKGSPIFDLNKLQWLNSRLINEMPVPELIRELRPWLEKKGLWSEAFLAEKKDWLERVVVLVRPRSRTLVELADMLAPFISDQVDYDPEAVRKHLLDSCLEELLAKLKEDFKQLETFAAPGLEQVLRARAEKEGIKAAVFIHALRVLLLGRAVGPGIFEVLEMMGKEKTLARLSNLAEARKMIKRTGEVRNG
ncbi:MAG TPA: glutamate--tRNA ligase [Candidatus Saccharicenans sp.]|nr:glutamate--tRNA ligase [Candidatus Saccharicenans sp.]HQO76020.1 glutamate--tRNA ligase [Candidatus Saccharicenans sp.]HUM78905.1 glutamate--tRNA ligase [Candidatus Saccharicenans sp.]